MNDQTDQTPQPAEQPVVAAASDAAAAQASDLPPAGDAWREVVAQMDALSSAIGTWAKAAYNDPEFRRHAGEIGEKFQELGSKVGETVDDVASSDFGRKVSVTADKVGEGIKDGADHVTKTAGPHVASAFASMASVLQKAAGQMDEAVRKHDAPVEPAPAPPVPPIPDSSADDD